MSHESKSKDEIDAGAAIPSRTLSLRRAINSLSTAGPYQRLSSTGSIQTALQTVRSGDNETQRSDSSIEHELEWLLVCKAASQVYGLVMNALVEQTLSMSNGIWYWDSVLSSYLRGGLYAVQISPRVLFRWTMSTYQEIQQLHWETHHGNENNRISGQSTSQNWTEFYHIVQRVVRGRYLSAVRSRSLSPLMTSRADARAKQTRLKRFREMNACGLGILMDEGLTLDLENGGDLTSNHQRDEWKTVISKSITLMETVLRNVTDLDLGTAEFEDAVFVTVEEHSENSQQGSGRHELSRPSIILANRLRAILSDRLPMYYYTSNRLVSQYGKPSLISRYWLPVSIMILSTGTIFRFIVNRKAQIKIWIQDVATTAIDFWTNWVLEPSKRVIATIRHDKESEIAIMSKRSLDGDRASLERMVVDFAVDNSDLPDGQALDEIAVADIRSKVREGDLTPVLKAYEKDLRRPFVGTVRGDLIRALLIQVQKTKVDIEVAAGGIDSLLKSQELVFG